MAAASAIALVLVFVATPYRLSANACTDAMKRCSLSVAISALAAVLGGFFPGVAIALSYMPFCYTAYAFCLAYFIIE